MFTFAFAARTVWSSSSDSVSCVLICISGLIVEAFNIAVTFASSYRNVCRIVRSAICDCNGAATSLGKSLRLIGEKLSAFTLSNWTSLFVVTFNKPICFVVFLIEISLIDCSKNKNPLSTYEQTNNIKGYD